MSWPSSSNPMGSSRRTPSVLAKNGWQFTSKETSCPGPWWDKTFGVSAQEQAEQRSQEEADEVWQGPQSLDEMAGGCPGRGWGPLLGQ